MSVIVSFYYSQDQRPKSKLLLGIPGFSDLRFEMKQDLPDIFGFDS